MKTCFFSTLFFLFTLQLIAAKDSTYLFKNLNFSLRSDSGIWLADGYPSENTLGFSVVPSTEYEYFEFNTSHHYLAEIDIYDCRTTVNDSTKQLNQEAIFEFYRDEAYKHRFPK